MRLIPQGPNFPVPEPDGNMEYFFDSKNRDMIVVAGDDACKPEEDDQSVLLTQAELTDLAWDLNLSKKSAQLLGSRPNEKYMLALGKTFYWYRAFHVPR